MTEAYCFKQANYGESDYCYNVCRHAQECAKKAGKKHESTPKTLDDKIDKIKHTKSKIIRKPNVQPLKTPEVPKHIQKRMDWLNN